MAFSSNFKNSKCEKSLFERLSDFEIQSLLNVDTAGLKDGDIICYHAQTSSFINKRPDRLLSGDGVSTINSNCYIRFDI